MSYQALSRVYDGFFEPDYHEKIVRRYRRILQTFGVADGKILDLGCGTGRLALTFARAGAQVCGVDPDADMIACAKEKSVGMPIEWRVATLPQVDGNGDFDAITASLDVVNHITREDQLLDTFCAARRLLRRGGVLVFDINTEKKFREVYGDNSYIFREAGALAAWENEYDEKREICQFTVDVFTQKGEQYERRTDIIYERMYREEQIRLLLNTAGFGTILRQGMDHGTRHIYIAK